MAKEARIRELLEQILETNQTPEQVCARDADLLPAVRERLQRHKALDGHLDKLFSQGPSDSVIAGPIPKSENAGSDSKPARHMENQALPLGPTFVVGTGTSTGDDLAIILRWRILVLLVLIAVSSTAFALKQLAEPQIELQFNLVEFIRTRPWIANQALVAAFMWTVACLVWRRKIASTRWLRAVEVVCLTVITAHLLWDMWYSNTMRNPMPELTELRYGNLLVNSNSLDMLFVIFAYGVFIPNTWLRCLTVLGILVIVSIAVSVCSLPWQALPEGYLWTYVTTMAVYFGTAMALAVYGAGRISILRVQVRQARRLGQYVLRDRLGGGGMGEVFRADHALLRRPAAVKLIRPDRAGDPATLARFEREVQATASLSHPNTIQIFDYGRTADGTFYYVMEHLDGLTLSELVKQHGTLPAERAVFLLCQICRALSEAHAIGLIHRDIKPGNVIVCRRGGVGDVAKLLDFGLVRSHSGSLDDASLTELGTVIGTPAYMSPEQAANAEDIDARSDIYSLGALAYFLLTGVAPFACRSPIQLLAAQMYETPPPLTAHRDDLSPELQGIIERCLAKNPTERFQDAHSLEHALEACSTPQQWTALRADDWWRHWADGTGPGEEV
jgi:eukaryotic-like serine/threonine-protein kinase